MTNTEYTHSQDVYPQTFLRRSVQQPLSGVGQDKRAASPARTASTQPAPLKKDMRSHEMNSNSSRTQSKPSPKRNTVQVTLWVKPVVKAELQRMAERDGLSVSATGGAFLEKAMQANVDMQYGALFQPIMEQAIRKHMRSISTHLAWLLVRVAFDSGQTRSLVTNILGRQPGITADELKNILDGSNKMARGNITRRTPQIVELIDAVEAWMMKEEEGRADA
jgi:hypothetical protein